MITVSKEGRLEPRYPECKHWKRVFTTHSRLTQDVHVDTNGKEYRVKLYLPGETWLSYFDLDEGYSIYSYVREFLEECYGDTMDVSADIYDLTSEAYDFLDYMDWPVCCGFGAGISEDDLDNFIEKYELTDEYPTKEEQDSLKKSIRNSLQALIDDYREYYSDLKNLKNLFATL